MTPLFLIATFILISTLLFTSKEKIQPPFTIKTFIPEKHTEFQNHIHDISTLMGDCFNNNSYVPALDNSLWVMVFSDTNLIGFLMIDSNNTIWNLCISKNYRGKKIASHAVNFAINYICKDRNASPTLLVKKDSEHYKNLIDLYKRLDFQIYKEDKKFTHMIYNCKKINY